MPRVPHALLLLAGSLAPVSLAAAQIVFEDMHDHLRNFQSAVLWDVNNDGTKELVIGGSHEVSAAVYDPDHISNGPLAMAFDFCNGSAGVAATPSGFLYDVNVGGVIGKYNSFTTAGANVDNGTATGLAFFEGTPWGDIAIVSGTRNTVPYLVAQVFGGINHNAELFAVPVLINGDRYLPEDLVGYRAGDLYMLDMTGWGSNIQHVSLGTDLAHPTLTLISQVQAGGLSGGSITGLVRYDGRYFATTIDQVGSALIPFCPGDVDHNGFVNGDDYDAFASAFESAHPDADFNADGFVNGDDYDAFAEHFESGC